MNAKEAYELSSRGAQNIAEHKIMLACEQGLCGCSLDNVVYEKCKQWLEENGYEVAWYGSNGATGISWEPKE